MTDLPQITISLDPDSMVAMQEFTAALAMFNDLARLVQLEEAIDWLKVQATENGAWMMIPLTEWKQVIGKL
jgi:hypothetical protein